MVLAIQHLEEMEQREQLTDVYGWTSEETFALRQAICSQWAVGSASELYHAKIARIQKDFLVNICDSVYELAASLMKTLAAKADMLVPNPALHSALTTLSTANKLTLSEVIALNSLIGGAAVENEFDIEAFYAEEDEMDM